MNQHNSPRMDETISIRAEFDKYLIHWKWFVMSIIVFFISSIVFIKTKVHVYETKASILIKEDGGASTDLKMFQDLSSLGINSYNNVFDEIEVLNSRYLASNFVKKLGLNVEFYVKNVLNKKELYGVNNPIKVKVLSDNEKFYDLDTVVDIEFINKYEFKLKVEESDDEIKAKFGEKINIGNYSFLLTPNGYPAFNGDVEKPYRLVFTKIGKAIEEYKNKLKISSVDSDSNIVSLVINHPNKEKSQDILNTLIELYNQLSIEDQNLVGKRTAEFVNKRLEVIKKELDEVDRVEELYKTDKRITDIASQSQVFVESKSKNETHIFQKETQLRLVNFMLEDINKNQTDFELLPASIGIDDNPQLGASVKTYNELLFERNKILGTSSSINPIVVNLDRELKKSIKNIRESLINTKKQLEIALTSLKAVETEFENRISSLPKKVREYRGIVRRQEIISQLYSYLLQKKEENEISMAVTIANSKVIDRAYSLRVPVSPKKKIIVFIALIMGGIIPFIILYLKDILDTKLKSKKDLDESLTIPLLGDIPLDKSGQKIVINKGSRTSTAEAFRLLRTNLDFMLTSVQTNCKTIFVTSTISGEGKTFVAVNLGASIALTGKKVLIIGMDLRAPKITQYLDLPNRNGVTNYLVDKNIELEDLIFKMDAFDNLHLLSSGVVPPNPAELLLNNRVSDLFKELKAEYDYIVVDTAPVNLVTDTLMISHHADMVLYTTRANYLDKRFLEVPERLYQEKRLPNMAILLNGLDYTRGYGYGYGGYGYPKEHEHKSFFQKIFRK